MLERSKVTQVKSTKGRKTSSVRWLKRHLNDPYVINAKKEHYRSRAAYKLIEINEKFNIIKPGMKIIDLGAAPGSWSQISFQIINPNKETLADNPSLGNIIGLDLLNIEPIKGIEFIQGDFSDEEIVEDLLQKINGKIDVILSDMAPNTSGHRQTDHMRIMVLCEKVYEFALTTLKEDGTLISKVFVGGTGNDLLQKMHKSFKKINHFKPKSSRVESTEMYVIATGFKGNI